MSPVELFATHWADYCQLSYTRMFWKSPLCINNWDDTTAVSFIDVNEK